MFSLHQMYFKLLSKGLNSSWELRGVICPYLTLQYSFLLMIFQIFILLLFKPCLCELQYTRNFFQWLLAIDSLKLYFCCYCCLCVSTIFVFSPSANLYGATYVPGSCYDPWIHLLVISALLPKAAEQTQTHWLFVCSVMEPTGQPRGQERKLSSLCLRGQMWFHSILC